MMVTQVVSFTCPACHKLTTGICANLPLQDFTCPCGKEYTLSITAICQGYWERDSKDSTPRINDGLLSDIEALCQRSISRRP